MLPRAEGSRLLDRALQKRWITLDDLVNPVAARRGYPGYTGLRRFVDEVSPGARSAAERLAHELLRANGITGWVANFAVHDGDVLIAVLDLAFPQLMLAIEIDGRAWHSAAERFQQDRTRQNRLVNAGWTVLRFTWEDLTARPADVISAIQVAIGRLGG